MKLICVEYNERGDIAYTTVGDNALLRNNEDFYIPAFTQKLSCVPQFVFRIGRIGKSISERFAGRYVDKIGVGLRFVAEDLKEQLHEKRLSSSMASSFDKSAVISSLQEIEEINYTVLLEINGSVVFQCQEKEIVNSISRVISETSKYFMYKIGDYLYCGNNYKYTDLHSGSQVKMYLNEDCLINFSIK